MITEQPLAREDRVRRIGSPLAVLLLLAMIGGTGVYLLIKQPISSLILPSLAPSTQGQCKILAEGTLPESNVANGIFFTSYTPEIALMVQTAQGKSGSADFGGGNSSEQEAQAILDHYQVGKVYSCWYDPTNPSHAVLDRSFPNSPLHWLESALGFVFAVLGLLGALGMIFSLTAFNGRVLRR